MSDDERPVLGAQKEDSEISEKSKLGTKWVMQESGMHKTKRKRELENTDEYELRRRPDGWFQSAGGC